MYVFTAAQLAASWPGHEGEKVTFTSQGTEHTGVLDSAFPSHDEPLTHLIVGADHIVVNDDVIVTVG